MQSSNLRPPACKAGPGKTLTALFGVAYTEISEFSALLIVPKLSRTRQLQAYFVRLQLVRCWEGGREAGFTATPDHKEQQDTDPPVRTECRLDPLSSEAADSRKEPRDSIAFRGKGTD